MVVAIIDPIVSSIDIGPSKWSQNQEIHVEIIEKTKVFFAVYMV